MRLSAILPIVLFCTGVLGACDPHTVEQIKTCVLKVQNTLISCSGADCVCTHQKYRQMFHCFDPCPDGTEDLMLREHVYHLVRFDCRIDFPASLASGIAATTGGGGPISTTSSTSTTTTNSSSSSSSSSPSSPSSTPTSPGTSATPSSSTSDNSSGASTSSTPNAAPKATHAGAAIAVGLGLMGLV